ncbi:MAG: hypothetical protein QF552_14745 [Litorilituus sp.]|jgi:hypothetical protein|nr:hypothetical protein [Litorilituus sp.]
MHSNQDWEGSMAQEDRSNMIKNTDINTEKSLNEQKTMQQQLADANNEIAELKLQIAWLERSYE